VAALASLAACHPARTAQTREIVIDDLAFGPAPAPLYVGDTVRWVNRDMFEHSATAEKGAFDIDLPAGGSGSAKLTRAGTIFYICKYHPGMRGRLIVSP
jgi:plastocyanin